MTKIPFHRRGSFPVSVKTRNEVVDYDYVETLSEEHVAYLKKFTNEYYQASFQHNDKLHTKDQVKQCYIDNNKRNRDSYSKARAIGKLYVYSYGDPSAVGRYNDDDSAYVTALDIKLKIKKHENLYKKDKKRILK